MALGSCQMDGKATLSGETGEFRVYAQTKISFLKPRTSKLGASEGSAFKIISEQVSSVLRANPRP